MGAVSSGGERQHDELEVAGSKPAPPMRVYVSGRIKDYPEYARHFSRAVAELQFRGYETVNPCDVKLDTPTYEGYMRADLKLLLDCEAIYMLSGWEQSAGARCEHLVAAMCGLQIMYEDQQ